MWCLPNDHTPPIITAKDHIFSAHRDCRLHLPETAIVFFMGKGVEYLCEHYPARKLPELFPRFANRCPIWEISEYGVCFLDGGRGAPQAADTVETLAALGVRTILTVGMFGAFDPRIRVGEIITPEKAFVEEGTSLHYYPSISYAEADSGLLALTASHLQVQTYPIVSTDGVFRQTFFKEQLWREQGAVGVDMETSAVFSVSRYIDVRAVSIMMASDMHPLQPGDPNWAWHMTQEMRYDLAEKSIDLVSRFTQTKD